MKSRETNQVDKVKKSFSAVISLKCFRSVKRTLSESVVSMSKLSKWLMSLHCYEKIGNNVPRFFLDFFFL